MSAAQFNGLGKEVEEYKINFIILIESLFVILKSKEKLILDESDFPAGIIKEGNSPN